MLSSLPLNVNIVPHASEDNNNSKTIQRERVCVCVHAWWCNLLCASDFSTAEALKSGSGAIRWVTWAERRLEAFSLGAVVVATSAHTVVGLCDGASVSPAAVLMVLTASLAATLLFGG